MHQALHGSFLVCKLQWNHIPRITTTILLSTQGAFSLLGTTFDVITI